MCAVFFSCICIHKTLKKLTFGGKKEVFESWNVDTVVQKQINEFQVQNIETYILNLTYFDKTESYFSFNSLQW